MPPSVPIVERIYQDIESTLRAITAGADYFTTFGTVTRGALSPLESLEALPWASLLPDQDPPDYDAVGVIVRQLLCAIRVWLDGAPGQVSTQCEYAIADVKKALSVDVTRGGVAQFTREQGVIYVYNPSTARLAGADILWQVDYKTVLTDPAQGA